MGKIKIKPENKGKFTAWAKSHGMSVQEAARHVLRNKEKYSSTLIKRANFARNASKWEEGGMMEYGLGGMLSTTGAAASLIPTPWTKLAGGALSLVGGLVGGAEKEKEEEKRLSLEKATKIDVAQNAAQAGIVNQYPATFKIGGRFRGKKFGGTPNAEVEGGETILTPDGTSTNIQGASHAKGGVNVQLPNESLIISKKYAKEVIPYTSKINKSKQMLENSGTTKLAKNSAKLNLNKYYSKVLGVYNKQEKAKFQTGGGYTIDDSWTKPDMFRDSYKTDFGLSEFNTGNTNWYDKSLLDVNYPNAKINTSSTKRDSTLGSFRPDISNLSAPQLGKYGTEFGTASPVDNTLANAPNIKTKGNDYGYGTFGDIASGIGEMAPMLYNLGMGLFGKRENLNAGDYRNPYESQINSLMANRKYDINPELVSNENAYRTGLYNLRNLGGSRGQIMSNTRGLQNAKMFGDMSAYATKKNMENQYAAEYAQTLYPLGRDTVSTKMLVDESNAMNRAAGRNMIGAGMTGLQQYLLTRRQMKNQAAQGKLLAEAIGAYSPYAGKWVPGMEEYVNSQKK